MVTATYCGSISMARHSLPVRSQAISVDPDPQNDMAMDVLGRVARHADLVSELGLKNHPLYDLAWFDGAFHRVATNCWAYENGLVLARVLQFVGVSMDSELANVTVSIEPAMRRGHRATVEIRTKRDVRVGEFLCALTPTAQPQLNVTPTEQMLRTIKCVRDAFWAGMRAKRHDLLTEVASSKASTVTLQYLGIDL